MCLAEEVLPFMLRPVARIKDCLAEEVLPFMLRQVARIKDRGQRAGASVSGAYGSCHWPGAPPAGALADLLRETGGPTHRNWA